MTYRDNALEEHTEYEVAEHPVAEPGEENHWKVKRLSIDAHGDVTDVDVVSCWRTKEAALQAMARLVFNLDAS